MRKYFVPLWIAVTVLMFLSAFIFKSGSIQNDVRERVTEDLNENGLGGAQVDANGRHITLSGVVPSEDQKESYLEVADDTYGALGPRDDLRVLAAAGGHFVAIKDGETIRLEGTVPSYELSESLETDVLALEGVASVDNALDVYGAAEPWHGNISGGLQLLGGLESGQFSASASTGSLIGRGDADDVALAQSFAPEGIESWSSMVASDGELDDLRATLDAREAELALSTQGIEDAQAEVTTLRDQNAAIQAERAKLEEELNLQASNAAALTNERDALQVEVDDLRQQALIVPDPQPSQDEEIAELNRKIEDQEAEIAQTTAASEAQIQELQGQIEKQNTQLDVAKTSAGVAAASFAAQKLALDKARGEVDAKQAELDAANAAAKSREDELQEQLAQQSVELELREDRAQTLLNTGEQTQANLADETRRAEASAARIKELETELDEVRSYASQTNVQMTDTSSRLAALMQSAATMETDLAAKEAERSALSAQLAEEAEKSTTLVAANQSVSGDVERLQGEVDGMEADIASLTTERDTARDAVVTLRGELDAKRAEAEKLTAENNQAVERIAALHAEQEKLNFRAATLDEQLTDANALVALRTGEHEKTRGELAATAASIVAMTTQRDDAVGALDGMQASLADMQQSKETAETELASANAEMEGIKAARDAAIAERDDIAAQLVSADQNIVSLTDERNKTMGDLDTANVRVEELEAELASLSTPNVEEPNQELTDALGRVDALETELADTRSQSEQALAQETARVASLDQQILDLQAQNEDALTSANGKIGELEEQIVRLQGDSDALQTQLGTAQEEVERSGELANSQSDVIATLQGERDTLAQKADEMNTLLDANAAEHASQIEALELEKAQVEANLANVEPQAARVPDLEARLNAANAQQQDIEAALARSDAALNDAEAAKTANVAQIALLTDERDAALALAATRGSSEPAARIAQCTALANAELEKSRINFNTSTASLTNEGALVLERITGIALACGADGTLIEIGGHTDDRGGDAANQALSEARATTVRDFMIKGGVRADSLVAVGYGETAPIADNATSDGRAANRRISFEWRTQ